MCLDYDKLTNICLYDCATIEGNFKRIRLSFVANVRLLNREEQPRRRRDRERNHAVLDGN